MEHSITPEDFKTREEAAQALKISIPTLDRLVARKAIGHHRYGGRVYFTDLQIAEFIAASERKCEVRA